MTIDKKVTDYIERAHSLYSRYFKGNPGNNDEKIPMRGHVIEIAKMIQREELAGTKEKGKLTDLVEATEYAHTHGFITRGVGEKIIDRALTEFRT